MREIWRKVSFSSLARLPQLCLEETAAQVAVKQLKYELDHERGFFLFTC